MCRWAVALRLWYCAVRFKASAEAALELALAVAPGGELTAAALVPVESRTPQAASTRVDVTTDNSGHRFI